MGKFDKKVKDRYEEDEFSDWEMDEDFQEIELDDDEPETVKKVDKSKVEEEEYYISDDTGEIDWSTQDRLEENEEYVNNEEEWDNGDYISESEDNISSETVYTFITGEAENNYTASIEQVPDATTQLPVISFDNEYVGYEQSGEAISQEEGSQNIPTVGEYPVETIAESYPEEETNNYSEEGTEDYSQEIEEDDQEDSEDDFDGAGYYDYEGEQEDEKALHGSLLEKAVVIGGVAVVVLCCTVGGLLLVQSKNNVKSVDTSSVGKQIKDVELIGADGLNAITNSYLKLGQIAEVDPTEEIPPLPEETPGYIEGDIQKAVKVSLSFTSIEKDLKIKFLNEDNGKLIGNVPFTVSVEGPDGKKDTWTDDDMDGIIYKKGIAGGKYKVVINTLEGEKYKDYGYSADTFSAEVKNNIEYKKVDVRGEIKKESQIDPSKEDTKKNPTPVEKYLNDTVPWLESAVLEGGYQEISKDQIKAPVAASSVAARYEQLSTAGDYIGKYTTLRLSSAIEEYIMTEPAPEPTQEPTPEPTQEPTPEPTQEPTPEPTQEPTPEPTQAPTPTIPVTETPAPTGKPTATPTPTTTVTPTPTIPVTSTPTPTGKPTSSPVPTTTPTPTPSATPTLNYSVRCNPSNLSMKVGESSSISAVAENMTLVNTFWTSSDSSCVSVDSNGRVTALKETVSPVTITVFAEGKGSNGSIVGSFTASCSVTVAKSDTLSPSISLGTASTDVMIGVPTNVTVSVTNADADGRLTVESSNTAVAVAEISSGAVKITGVSQGTATITVHYIHGNTNISATCNVNVIGNGVDPRNDHTTILRDQNGNELYVMDNDTYRQAHSADYYTYSKFFVKATAKYQGWQTVGGRLRYYDASGNPITGKQVIQGVEYDFGTDGYVRTGETIGGIDVSKWNGDIDWAAVKNSGVSYVIIRCGYRGSSAGALIEDPKFRTNIQGASAAGLKVGVYFFTQAVDRVEAIEEASMVLDMVKDYNITYPIFLDVEPSGGRADGISKQTRTEVCTAFCATIQGAGYTAGVYANSNWFTEKIDAGALGSYKIWLAQYASKPTYTGRYDLWQYKKSGKVAGIRGDVDLNLSYMGY